MLIKYENERAKFKYSTSVKFTNRYDNLYIKRKSKTFLLDLVIKRDASIVRDVVVEAAVDGDAC